MSSVPFRAVTEFCQGGNLWNALRCNEIKVDTFLKTIPGDITLKHAVSKGMPLLDVSSIATDICHALVYLHRAGFAHRDIKSNNVLLTWCSKEQRICAKLCDFGTAAPVNNLPRRPAKPKWGGFERFFGFSGSWQPIGTVLWMAPEMLEPPVEGSVPPEGYSGEKVDIYSLGVVIWELFEWRTPWTGEETISRKDIIDVIVHRDQRLPISRQCVPKLAQLMSLMWTRRPFDRPSSREVLSELETVGSSWDTLELFTDVRELARVNGKAIIEALEASSTSKGNGVQGDAEQEEYFHRVGNYDAKCSHQDIHGSDTIRFPKRTDAPKRNMQNIDAVQRMRDEGISEEQKDSETKETNTNMNTDLTTGHEPDPTGDANILGSVGSLSLSDLDEELILMLFRRVHFMTSDETVVKELENLRSKLAKLQSSVGKLQSRTKLDPFAAFTADAQHKQIEKLTNKIDLLTAQEKEKVWRFTREILHQQLIKAESEYTRWQRNCRSIQRKDGK